MPSAANSSRAGQRAHNSRRVQIRATEAQRAHQVFGRHGIGDQRVAHRHVRRAYKSRQERDRKDMPGRERVCHGEGEDDGGEHAIERSHGTQHGASTEHIARDAEEWRQQRAEILERAIERQKENRFRLDQDVPTEYQVLHLECPGRQHVGRPLEPEAAHREGRERTGSDLACGDGWRRHVRPPRSGAFQWKPYNSAGLSERMARIVASSTPQLSAPVQAGRVIRHFAVHQHHVRPIGRPHHAIRPRLDEGLGKWCHVVKRRAVSVLRYAPDNLTQQRPPRTRSRSAWNPGWSMPSDGVKWPI